MNSPELSQALDMENPNLNLKKKMHRDLSRDVVEGVWSRERG